MLPCLRALKLQFMTTVHNDYVFPLPLFNALHYYTKSCGMGANAELSLRHCHHNTNEKGQEKKLLKRLYFPNPLKWLLVKLDLLMLKNQWDPEFEEMEFKRGTKQAVSVITSLVSRNMFSSLEELMTKPAFLALRSDVETSWSDEARRNIELSPTEIMHAIPRRVYLGRTQDRKICEIDMLFLALKWTEHRRISAAISVDIFARFHRDYSAGQLPAWTVSLFRVTHFRVIPFNYN